VKVHPIYQNAIGFFDQITEIPLGFQKNYQNTLGLSEKLPKYPWRSAWSFHGPFWAFLILGFSILAFFDFGLLIIN
jgi:hypothetical protein